MSALTKHDFLVSKLTRLQEWVRDELFDDEHILSANETTEYGSRGEDGGSFLWANTASPFECCDEDNGDECTGRCVVIRTRSNSGDRKKYDSVRLNSTEFDNLAQVMGYSRNEV